MPVLEVLFHSFPVKMNSGQICQCVIEINNKGSMGLKNLFVKSSHPTVFQFGEPTDDTITDYGTIYFN